MDKLREYVKKNKNIFIDATLNGKAPESSKVAIFMAGAPGSGKSESARALCGLLENIVVIDADKYRSLMPGYSPQRAADFQSAANLAVDKVLDEAIHGDYSFILDATFASSKALGNVKRAIRHGYLVLLVYVSQKPEIAWQFTKIRENRNDRNVPRNAFINACYASRENFGAALHDYNIASQAIFMLIKKDYRNNVQEVISEPDRIKDVIKMMYNNINLNEIIQ